MMAERRMFAKSIIDSDAFLDLPTSAQLLYFQLGMRADDDGFINNPKMIMRIVRASDDDINILIAKKFIIPFENGVVVIKHWKINNYLRSDRYSPSKYKEQLSMLTLDENNSYTLKKDHEKLTWDTNGIPDGYQTDTNGIHRLGKVRLGKGSKKQDARVCENNEKEGNVTETSRTTRPVKHKHGEQNNVLLTEEEHEKVLEIPDGAKLIEDLSLYMGSTGKSYKSHYLTILNWVRMRKDKGDDNGKRKVAEPEWVQEYIDEVAKMEG